jgi:hypothetical protein
MISLSVDLMFIFSIPRNAQQDSPFGISQAHSTSNTKTRTGTASTQVLFQLRIVPPMLLFTNNHQ